MAQSKSFFGLRKGSTKSLTFQVLNGKQITKDRVYNVKNPQTIAQMQQRAFMATVVQAYSKMKTICDHSFEGVEVGSRTMSEFLKNNLSIVKLRSPEVNLTYYKESNYAPNKYLVSKGTLPTLQWGSGKDGEDANFYQFFTDAKWSADLTYKALAESCGLKQDGMLTLMMITEEGEFFWLRLKFTAAIMKSEAKLTDQMNLAAEMLKIDGNSVEGNTTAIAGDFVVNNDDGDLTLRVKNVSTEGVALIKSQKIENVWRRSTNYLEGGLDTSNYEMALATYPINTSLLLNGGKMPSNVIKK